jgi:hypothetical protein
MLGMTREGILCAALYEMARALDALSATHPRVAQLLTEARGA